VRGKQIAGGQQLGLVAQGLHDGDEAIGVLQVVLAGAQPAVRVQRRHDGARRRRVRDRGPGVVCSDHGSACIGHAPL